MSDLALQLSRILKEKGWLSAAEATGQSRDWLDRYGASPLGIARPQTTEEVSRVIAACLQAGVAVIPQGGNTSLCGGAVAGAEGQVILSLARMNRIGELDRAGGNVTVEAGVVLESLHQHLALDDRIFPLHLGAEGSAQIGGLIATNAGGSLGLRYGTMQDLVIGLEIVLADGRIWNGLRRVQKDNAGYQLRRLFCGSEGTLGIVTRAALKVYPAPKATATALLAVPDAAALVALGARLRANAGEFASALEFFCETGLGMVERNLPDLRSKLETRATWYLLVELSTASPYVPLDDILEGELSAGMEQGWVLDGTIAGNAAQRAEIWRLREEQPEGQRREGPQLKHDISVPVGQVATFIDRAGRLCDDILPGVRVNPFGHLGDGNIHYNLSPPVGGDFGSLGPKLTREIAELADRMGGSFAAEHGLGRAKIDLADALRSPVERQLMTRIKRALDPDGLFNPGVVVAERPQPLPVAG